MKARIAAGVAVAVAGLVCAVGCGLGRAGKPLTPRDAEAGTFTLCNPRLTAVVMVPDKPSSPYYGQRFESGGVVLQVTLDGRHTFLGLEARGERLGGFGLIEEMGILEAVAYEDAKPGEPFLKLGIGLLQRDEDPAYNFFKPRVVVERFGWEVATTPAGRRATFVQVGKPFRGYAYRYEKRIVLDPAKPVLRIEHAFTNTGEKPIASDQYCHNFLRFDDAPPGPDYVVVTPFPLKPDREAPAMRIEEQSVSFRDVLKEPAYCRFKGQDASARGHSFRVFHKSNGLAVTVGGDFPISYVAYYADPQAISPEAFCAIRVKPGETFRWTRTYRFGAERR